MFDARLTRNRGNTVAVADIGSGSAAVAIATLAPGFPASVCAAERSTLSLEERSKEATIAGLGEHLAEAGEKALKKYMAQSKTPAPVGQAFCVIHAPWSRSVTVYAHSEFSKDTVITQAMVGELAKQALGDQTQIDSKSVLEASIVRAELNGYPTGKPAGKPAHRLGVWALVSDCDPSLRAGVQTSLRKVFPHVTPVFRSSTRAILSMLYQLQRDALDALVVDVALEGTTLIALREGIVVEQHTISEGIRSILKRIAPSGMPEETLSLIRMLGRDQCSSAACEAIQSSMAKVEPELVRSFGEGMAACSPTRRLSDKMLLIAQPDILPWLTKFFSRIDFTQFTLTTRPFTVESLTPKDLSPYVTPSHGAFLDMGIAFSVALVNREQEQA